MEKEFYYLDDKEQKGPFNIDQLKTIGLKPETLVWTEGFENWKPLKDVEELKVLIKRTPPPPPIVDNLSNSSTQQSEVTQVDKKKILVDDSNVKIWVSFKIYFIVILLFGFAAFSAYLISYNKKQKLKKEIYTKIDNILDGKTVVLDGIIMTTKGELIETGYSESKNKNKEPFAKLSQEWWERDKLYTIFEATGGGFIIKQLTKLNNDSYDLDTYSSGDMGYKKPANYYVEPVYMDIGWGERLKVSDGYYFSNFRPSVTECYNDAFNFFTKEGKLSPGAFSPGKYLDISNFPYIWNEYFNIENVSPKEIQFSTSGKFGRAWYTIDEHVSNINSEDYVVYFSRNGKHYEITENKKAIKKDLLTYFVISEGLLLLLLHLLRSSHSLNCIPQ